MRLRLFFLIACVCLSAARIFADDAWYESNSIGTPRRSIELYEGKGLEYVLHVNSRGDEETRTLFDADGVEVRRRELLYADGYLEEETVYIDGVKDSLTVYYPSGLVKEEALFTNGREDGRFLFVYPETDDRPFPDRRMAPLSVSFSRPDTVGFQDEYQYLPSGDFRGLKRIYTDGVIYSSVFTTEKSVLREEWHSFGSLEILFRYDRRGNVRFAEEYRNAVLVERSEFRYDAETPFRLREKSTRNSATGGEVLLEYGEDGKPLRESVFEDGVRTGLTLFTYEDSLLVRKERRRRDGREEWEYFYDADKKLLRENYLRGGVMELIQYYEPEPDYTRIEEYYKKGEFFLRLYYKDGEEIKRDIAGEENP
jgi:antitoxin component YwqK of YwqJK toxin-antitoxin module